MKVGCSFTVDSRVVEDFGIAFDDAVRARKVLYASRSAFVEDAMRQFVEKSKPADLPEIARATCPACDTVYPKTLNACPRCEEKKAVFEASVALKQQAEGAAESDKQLEQKFQAWISDKSEKGGFGAYLDRVGTPEYGEWKAKAKEKLRVEE